MSEISNVKGEVVVVVIEVLDMLYSWVEWEKE
jgi:hypothetical protein